MPIRPVRRKGSPHWYIRGEVNGCAVFESARTHLWREAKAIADARTAELAKRPSPAARVSFLEAAVGYMEAGGEARFLRPLIDRLGDLPVSLIAQPEIDAAARALYAGRAPATVNRQVHTPVSAVLRFAAKRGWCAVPLLDRPRLPGGRVRWLAPAEAERLIAAAAPHLKPLVVFLLLTGARLSEALHVDWHDVDLARAHVSFTDTKNGSSRGVPLHPRAVAALAGLPHRQGAVFRCPDGLAYRRRADGGGQIRTGFQGACRRAGIAGFTPHDCRHTWATWHYAANRDLVALMQLGGWKSERMVLRYVHADSAHLAPSVAAIAW